MTLGLAELLKQGQKSLCRASSATPSDGTQDPRVWRGNDGEHRASYEVIARTVKFLGKREGNGGAPIGEPPSEYLIRKESISAK